MFESRAQFTTATARADGTALKAIGWGELTARINAARDLRRVLRRENPMLIASFSDAAAGYFSQLDESKRPVNPDGLGHGKGTDGICSDTEGDAATGDRET